MQRDFAGNVLLSPVGPYAPPSQDFATISPIATSGTNPNAPRPPLAPHGLHTRSCDTCRKRKVKCDKLVVGCSNCKRAHIPCVYPGPGRAPRRPKSNKVPTPRETELLKRLKRLEGVVKDLSSQVDAEGQAKSSNSTSSPREHKDGDSESGSAKNHLVRVVGMDEGNRTTGKWLNRMSNIGDGPPDTDRIARQFGKLVIDEGKTHYINNDIFASLNAEFEDIREIFEEDNDDDSFDENEGDDPPPHLLPRHTPGHQEFIAGYSSANVDLRSLHPLPSQILFYWDKFIENVDPLTKVIHVPTVTKAIKEAKDNLDNLSKSMEALMFAIYFAVITSMNDPEIGMALQGDKMALLAQYRFGVEQSLARADFLSSTEIVTVQALVLFLVCVRRHDQTRFVWALTGLAIRLAIGIGLHRDGTNLGLSPFDTEMRRRIWWQICVLDIRAAEDHGSDPLIREDAFDTHFPLNLNDEDLYPDMVETPTEHVGVSHITFCMIRFEICRVARSLTYGRDTAITERTFEQKEQMVYDLHEMLERKYIQYCLDVDAEPLYWVAATVSRLIVAKMSIIVFFRGAGVPDVLPQQIRDRLFIAAIEIMEYSTLLEAGSSTKKWGWLFHTYVQWHAIIYILREVCIRPRCPLVDRAWRAVDGVFNDWGDAVKHSKSPNNGMLWLPLKKLMAKARKKREVDLNAASMGDFSGHDPRILKRERCALPEECPTADDEMSATQFANIELVKGIPGVQELPVAQPGQVYTALPAPWGPGDDNAMTGQQNHQDQLGQQEQGQNLANIQMQTQYPMYDHMQLQQAQAQAQQVGATPWILEPSALVDLDMAGVGADGEEFSWDGFDDLVRDFQSQAQAQAQGGGRDEVLSGLGGWW